MANGRVRKRTINCVGQHAVIMAQHFVLAGFLSIPAMDKEKKVTSSRGFSPVLTYIGGSTLLIEIGKIRFLTDPTFDPAGTEYPEGVPLSKTGFPALRPDELPIIDAVLLSHDQHKDNLDTLGANTYVA